MSAQRNSLIDTFHIVSAHASNSLVPRYLREIIREGQPLYSCLKPNSHCAGVATVHPDAGLPVYRDAPGHISQKINCVLTVPTLPRYSPGFRESKTPVEPRFTTEHLRCSTVEPRFVPVYPGVTQVVYGDVPVTAGCATVTCR